MRSCFKILNAWRQEAAKPEAGEITKEKYDKRRYKYFEFDTRQKWAKVPSQKLNDMPVKGLNKQKNGSADFFSENQQSRLAHNTDANHNRKCSNQYGPVSFG